MTDLYVQARILCYLYESYNRGKPSMLPQNLHQKEHLQYVNPIVLKNELDFLKGKQYVDSTQQGQQQQCKLSAIGIEKTESLYTCQRRSSGISQIIAIVAGFNNSTTCGPIKVAPTTSIT